MRLASGRIVSSGGAGGGLHSVGNAAKRTGSGSSTTTTVSTETTLGAADKLGGARDKERKEKEDVELRPPWDLLPYSRDSSAGTGLEM